jgi:methyl-accepting chemotaxis protein
MSNNSDTQVTLDTALQTHREWKARLNEAVKAGEHLDDETISRDNCCELGKWLYSDGRHMYGHAPEFARLIAAHSEFHQVTAMVARLINGKDRESVDSMLQRGSQFTAATAAVTLAIVQMQEVVSRLTE